MQKLTKQLETRSNIYQAIEVISNIIKSSFGPNGLDKLIINDIGDICITNQGSIIIQKLQVEHPAAKILADISLLQQKEGGDGTTSVIILAAELMKKAVEMLRKDIPPTLIIQGYKIAMKEAKQFLSNQCVVKEISKSLLVKAAINFMGQKQESEYLAQKIVDSCQITQNIQIQSCHGQSVLQSELLNGYVIQASRASSQMPNLLNNAKLALVSFPLKRERFQFNILVQDPKEVEFIRKKELQLLEQKLQILIKNGVNVIVSSKSIDETAISYLLKNKCIAIRQIKTSYLIKLAQALKLKILNNLNEIDGPSQMDNTNIAQVTKVEEIHRGEQTFINIEAPQLVSILIRGPNEIFCNNIKRKVKRCVKNIIKLNDQKQAVAGGGACEAALQIYLQDFACRIPSILQTVVAEFANALISIPRTLCINSNLDTLEVLGNLRTIHHTWQRKGAEQQKNLRYTGINLINGKLQNCIQNGVIETLDNKIRIYRYATETVITLIRIDEILICEKQVEN